MARNVLVVLVDRNHGHFYEFDTQTHHLKHLKDITDDVPQPVKSGSWAALADDKINRHVEQHIVEHMKGVMHEALLWLRQSEADFIIGGQGENTPIFVDLIPSEIKKRFLGVINPDVHSPLNEIEAVVAAKLTETTHDNIEKLVKQIEEQREPNGLGLVGADVVFEGLNQKQVRLVLLGHQGHLEGYYCEQDGSVGVSQSTCPVCFTEMKKSEDLHEAIKHIAAIQNATVIEVDSDSIPLDYGQIAALKRFAD